MDYSFFNFFVIIFKLNTPEINSGKKRRGVPEFLLPVLNQVQLSKLNPSSFFSGILLDEGCHQENKSITMPFQVRNQENCHIRHQEHRAMTMPSSS